MNNFCGVGRLTKDVEIKKTNTGKSVANFILAINNQFKKGEADFINCQVWEKQAENLALYCNKGSLISVEGRIQTSNYMDNNNNKVYKTEIICTNIGYLEFKGDQNAVPNAISNTTPNSIQNSKSYAMPNVVSSDSNILAGLDVLDDELPF
ncbi:MAG: single-stranded DNA-binding protein [Oscillospiraceae bacterium]